MAQDCDEVIMLINYFIEKAENGGEQSAAIPAANSSNQQKIKVNNKTATGGWWWFYGKRRNFGRVFFDWRLPGTIMQIFVNVGDEVKRGDKILMYEAMKMENNFLAEVDGVIKDIKVKVGDNILQGAVLAIIG